MKAFRNMKIKTKILFGFIIVIVLLAVIAAEAIISLVTVNNVYSTVISSPLAARAAVLDFIGNYRDARRMNMTLAANIGYNANKCEEMYDSAVEACESAEQSLKDYEAAVNGNKNLSAAEKDSRLARVASIRSKLQSYKENFLKPMIALARDGGSDPDSPIAVQKHKEALDLITSGGTVANDIRDISLEMRDVVITTANNSIDVAHKDVKQSIIMLSVIAFVALVSSVIISFVIAASITGDINFLSGIMEKLTKTGNFKKDEEIAEKITMMGEKNGAVGLIYRSYEGLTDMMHRKLATLQDVANGDLTTVVAHRSDNDSYGNALQKMVDSLNDMFSEIKTASEQVTVGSSQIADGSQVLASGASEQAATLEELTATIEDVSKKTLENAEKTNNANHIAANIMKNAEKGTKQMEAMINAVNEINEANQNISVVMKAIDDIAFQTNILALNAAVEAARAGAAGKGFAVVAEEVRNLAGKSAESAKETSKLISNSVAKAQLGTQIAGETANSLNEIVEGITESNEIIAEIARSSEEQTEAVRQISDGINTITQVVQQNSAATEQSAAAAEQMSGQAAMLEELVKRFKLRNN